MQVLVASLLTFVTAAAPAFDPLETCVPADAMAAYFGRPSPEMLSAPRGGTADNIASWLITLKGMGVIPRDGRVAADILGSVPILWRRPHTLMLLDITTREIYHDVYRLDQMQAAVVIANTGIELAIERRVRDLLATYTDADHGKIAPRQIDGVTVYTLTDDRLPDWAIVQWAQVDAYFVGTFGAGAFERVYDVLRGRRPSLADDVWFARAHARVQGGISGLEVYGDLARVRDRLAEDAKDRPADVLRALGLEKAEQVIWATGHDDRAVRSLILGRLDTGEDVFIRLASRENASSEVAAQIPQAASSYFVIRAPLDELFNACRAGYLRSQSHGQRRAVRELWARLQAQYHFDSETQVLDHLGDHFIVHTWPEHPLKLPLLWTVWIQLAGDHQAVAVAVDRMMTAWQDALNAEDPPLDPPDPGPRRPRFRLSPRLLREDDGLWSLQLGFIRPALAVTDGWIVVSFSPEAVRANLRHLGTPPSSAPAPPWSPTATTPEAR